MQSVFIISLLFSFHEAFVKGEETTKRSKHLFVQRREPVRGSSLPIHEIYFGEDGSITNSESLQNGKEGSRRAKRSARERRATKRDPRKTLHKFMDNHHMLYVQWTGLANSDTVVVVSRDIHPSSSSTSYLYVSSNYGVSYQNQSAKLTYKDKKGVIRQGLIHKFYNSPIDPRKYIFADITHNVLFISTDDCSTFKAVQLTFKPSNIVFHLHKGTGLLAYDETTKTIHYSTNFGSTWTTRQKKVKSYFWGIEDVDSQDTIYLEIENGTSSYVVKGHYDHKHYSFFRNVIISGISDFEVKGEYLFATKKNGKALDLYVAYRYPKFEKAEFPNNVPNVDYVIADVSEGQVFVAVNHNKNTTHLYISDVTGKKYITSLERVLYFNPDKRKDHWLRRYIKDTFIDLHPVAAMRGIYVASQLEYGKVGTRAIYTMITYDKGMTWRTIRAPRYHANGSAISCSYDRSCSLHLALNYAARHPYYTAPSIKSKPSAPGLIISSGNVGGRLRYASNVYLSNDAGEEWLEVLEGKYYFNFGDHGGVIVAVRQWSPTRELLYSTNEGLNWTRYNFTKTPIRVYGLLTEPGETTTVFTVFGSYKGRHSWLVVQVNMTLVLGRKCTSQDYEKWSPYSYGYGHKCLLGQRLVFERRKRNSVCFNGHDYDRPVNKNFCTCSWKDFECDSGFIRLFHYFCLRDRTAGFNPYAPPRPCPRGTFYNRTRGFRKIPGDKCVGGAEYYYGPMNASCPFKLDTAYLMFAEREKIDYVDLTNNSQSTVIEGLRGAVALAYDIKEGYIYWADMLDHKIMRRTLNATDEAITIAGIKQVEGMDFDWTTDNLYWIDSAEQVIEVCKKNGWYRKTVHRDDLDKPRALALDPAKGKMFWSDWGSSAKIEMSDMDGTNRTVLVNKEISWPNGLAVDIYNPNHSWILYWTDAKIDKIETYNLKTKVRKVIVSRVNFPKIVHPYSIAVDDKYIYWDDWQTGSLYKLKKSLNGKPSVVVKGQSGYSKGRKFEVKVYYKRSQSDKSTCTGRTCAQLCLPKPNRYNCTCGDDTEVVPGTNGQQCKCIGGLKLLHNGTCVRQGTGTCAPHEFACRSGGDCINSLWKCDNFTDCPDGSDEENCNFSCPGTQFRCPGSYCIPRQYVCDGQQDCLFGFDEKNCSNVHCETYEFHCKNKRCISIDQKCDYRDDCGDNSDERGCPTVSRDCPNRRDFRCYTVKRCIPGKLLCNGYPNCPDNSDEINCVSLCNSNQFMCADRSACIPKSKRCDGILDCKYDSSDELLCVPTPPTTARTETSRSPVTPTDKTWTGTNDSDTTERPAAQRRESKKENKTLVWAIPVGVVFGIMLVALVYFVVKSRKLQRSFYHLVRQDSFDGGVAYHNNGDDDDVPLIQGFSDDDPLVEA